MKITFNRLVMTITFLAIFAMAARVSVDTDTWWHLRAGQWIIEHHRLLTTDPFSYTRFGAGWHYPGWLVQVNMYWIYKIFGPGGLNLWTAIMVCLAFIFVWKTTEGNSFIRAFTMVFAAAASGVYWAARPYLVTFILTAVYIWLFETLRKNDYLSIKKSAIWMSVLMIIWANSHAGFFAGFLIWGVYFLDALINWFSKRSDIKVIQGLFRLGLLLVVCVCINPYGVEMLAYPFKTMGISALQDYIQEWQSPNFHSISVQPFAWLILLVLGSVGLSGRKMLLSDFLLTGGFAYMGLMAGRNIALFGIAAPMVITRHLSPVLDGFMESKLGASSLGRVTHRQNILNWGILFLLILAVLVKVSLVFPISANEEVFKKILPVKAVNYIKQTKPEGRLFNSYNWGGYLLWNLPDYPVFIDGRTDLYDDEIIDEWIKVVKGEDGWEETLDEWQVKVILIEPGMRLTSLLGNEWKLNYEDEIAQVWERK
jgi:hypothetical protein